MRNAFFSDLIESLAEKGRALIGRGRADALKSGDLGAICEALLSGRGEASGMALAEAALLRWQTLDGEGRRNFLNLLAGRFGPDQARLDAAISAYQKEPGQTRASQVHIASEPRRQELFRRLNQASGGTLALVRMREALLRFGVDDADHSAVDADFVHLFTSWFNRGFLVLRRIDWSTPANILEKIIAYEAVHAIGDWRDLRARLEPADRRCFAFFHPRLLDEPLIFVEVALTDQIPSAIAPLLAQDRTPIDVGAAKAAIFYSISNCQEGLRGISFGNFLIKQVVEEIKRDLPQIDSFATLSPVPGFAKWLRKEASALGPDARAALARGDWWQGADRGENLRAPLLAAAAQYFLEAKNAQGRPVDPVARFHLGNGARLERLNLLGDISAKGLAEAHGLMVNYLYKLDDIERNHEAFANSGEVAVSAGVKKLLRPEKTRQGPPRAAQPENAAGHL